MVLGDAYDVRAHLAAEHSVHSDHSEWSIKESRGWSLISRVGKSNESVE